MGAPAPTSDAEIINRFLSAVDEAGIDLVLEFSWDATGQVTFASLPECGTTETARGIEFRFSASSGALNGDWDTYRALAGGPYCYVGLPRVEDWRGSIDAILEARTAALIEASDDRAVLEFRARAWAALSTLWIDFDAISSALLWDGEACWVTGPRYTFELPDLELTAYRDGGVTIETIPGEDVALGGSGVICYPVRTSPRYYPGQ